ncbi:MAG: hypothetical protein MUE60_01785, partial [Candidatus Eisenbacteria bacterium]|nr:hypothetical protein [Candidatus Eisenbacteria bacterium]
MGTRGRAIGLGMLRSALAFLPMAAVAVAVVLAGRGPGPEDLPQLLLQPTPQSPPGPRLDPGLLGEGWEEAFEPETFGPEELYAKINGGADVYLSHGFRQLKVHSFLHASSGDYVEAFL